MVDFSGPTLGDVTVEVRAKLDKLINDFARARGETKNFESDMAGVTRATKSAFDETNKLEAEYRALARAYDPVRAAATKYGDALVRIQRLQGAGFLSPTMARQWAGAARAEFDRTANSVHNLHRRFEGIEGVIGSVKGLMAGLGVTLAVELVQRLAEFAEQTIKSTAEIGEFAKQIGFTAQEVQAYRAIAADLGVTQTDVDGAFKEFNQTVRQAAAGLERPAKLFDLLNIKLNDASGQLRPMNELFLETVDKLGQVGNKAEQAAGQAVAFGETFGPKMSQAVGMGSEKIQELVEAINATGVVLSNEEIQKADETAKKLEALNNQLKAKVAKAVLENSDALITLTSSMNGLTEAALNVPSALAGVAGSIPQIAIEALKAIPVIGQMVALLELLGQVSGNVRGFGVAGKQVTVGLGKAVPLEDRIKAAFANADRAEGKPRGDLSLAGLLAPKGRTPRGRKGGGGRTQQNQFDREELRAREENLRLIRDQTTDLQLQNEIDKQLIDIRVGERAEQLDQMVSRKSLTAAQAKKLKDEDAANAVIEKELADRRMHQQMIEQSARYAEEMLGLEQDGLALEARMARTDAERRRIELLILSSKQQQARNEIEKEIALAQESKNQQRVAELVEERRKLIENQNAEIAAFDVENLTGFAKFRNDLPRTVDEINEQIDRIRFDKFKERLQQAADFIDDIGGAFGRLADPQELLKNPLQAFKNFIFDLTRIFNENFIQKPVEEWAKKAIGGPLAKQAFGKGLMKDGGLNTEQMNVALGLASNNLRILQIAAQNAAMALNRTAAAGGAGAGGDPTGGFVGSLFGSDGNMADPMQVNLGAGLGVTGTVDFEQGLESTTAALDPLASTAGQLTQAMGAQIPVLGQFGSGLMQVLSSLASGGGGGGGGFMDFLKMGVSLAGSAFGGFPGSAGMSVPAAPSWLGSFGSMPVSLGSGLGVTGTIGWDTGGPTGGSDPKKVAGVVHEQEYVFDAGATKMWGVPLLKKMQTGEITPDDLMHLDGKPGFAMGGFTGGSLTGMISSGRLPTWASPRDSDYPVQSGGGRPITIGSINLHGVKDDRTARRSARQFRAGLQRELAYVNRSGLNR